MHIYYIATEDATKFCDQSGYLRAQMGAREQQTEQRELDLQTQLRLANERISLVNTMHF